LRINSGDETVTDTLVEGLVVAAFLSVVKNASYAPLHTEAVAVLAEFGASSECALLAVYR
jgi:hypothetical protein